MLGMFGQTVVHRVLIWFEGVSLQNMHQGESAGLPYLQLRKYE